MFKRALVIAATAWFTAVPALAQVSGTLEITSADSFVNGLRVDEPWQPVSAVVSSDLTIVTAEGGGEFWALGFEAHITGLPLMDRLAAEAARIGATAGLPLWSTLSIGTYGPPGDRAADYRLFGVSYLYLADPNTAESGVFYLSTFEFAGSGADRSLFTQPYSAASFQAIFETSTWSFVSLSEDLRSGPPSAGIQWYTSSSAAAGGAATFSPVTPVPEPSTYALMLAGLAAVLWTARRRRTARGAALAAA